MAYSALVDDSFSKFRHPFTAICAGATCSGKSTFISHVISCKKHVITPVPERVIYSYKAYQPLFDSLHDVEFVQGMNFKLDKTKRTLLIIDDQFADKNDQLIDLFSVKCHHENTSIILVTQCLYYPDKSYRVAVMNSMYMILFKSPRDVSSVSILARQMFSGAKAKAMVKAYDHATSKPYGYLLIDMKPDTPESLRLRSNVLPHEGDMFQGVRLMHCYVI